MKRDDWPNPYKWKGLEYLVIAFFAVVFGVATCGGVIANIMTLFGW